MLGRATRLWSKKRPRERPKIQSLWVYYICSGELSAKVILNATRKHWHIENKLHWVLDMDFRKDEGRVRKGYGAEGLSRLRHIALNLLKANTSKTIEIKINA